MNIVAMHIFRISIFFSLMCLYGCMDLESSLFNQQKLSSYNFSNAIIPDSNRTQITLTSQGKKIYGYYVRSNGSYPRITVLYNHGNRDHLQYYWDRVELLYKMGFNVFIYDYQGFGMSEGEPSEGALYSDALTALQYIRSRGDVADTNLVLYGFSLGCAAAVNVAATTFTPRVLILESPFASATALVQSGTALNIPGSYIMKGEYNNAEKIKYVHCPLLLLHGEADTFLDIEKNSEVLFQHANEPKKFVRVPKANHSDVPWVMGEGQYLSLVAGFVLNPQTR